ncbi:hypothetical protein STEG23_024981, partial [Scotinomys teguina]
DLNNDTTNRHGNIGGVNLMGPHPDTKNYRKLRSTEKRRNHLGDGETVVPRDDSPIGYPIPSISAENIYTDSGFLHPEQKGSWDSDNFWLDPSVKGQLETSEEEGGLRKSLDRFYEAFAHPLPGSGDQLSASVCQCLSQTISELEGQESQKYALHSFQMARVIFNRDGCSILQQHSRETRFCPLEQEGSSVEDEEPTPGLSREIIHFLLKQTIIKDS